MFNFNMPQCSVPGCRNGGVHLFPKDPELRKKWVKAIRRKKSVTNFLRLCRDHFKESDYVGISAYTGRPQINRYLKKGVIPSIFPWTEKSVVFQSLITQEENNAPVGKDVVNQDIISMDEEVAKKIKELGATKKPSLRNKKTEM